MERATIHVKVLPELRARADACARMEGIRTAELVRRAILTECERIEKLASRRERVHRRAGGGEDS